VAEKNHAHSTLNPLAQYQKQFSLDEVMHAEMVSYPNTLLMCCPTGDGAAAVVLVSGERLKTLSAEQQRRAVKVSASVLTSDPWTESDQVQPDVNTLTRNAAAKAYETAGVDPSDEESTMGVRGMSHTRIRLDDVRIDDSLRLGQIGEGLRIMFFGLAAERIDIAARALGCATRAFEEARAYAGERMQFGKPLRALQAVSHKISQMRTTIDAGRLLVLRAARLYDEVLVSQGPEEASEACNEESSIAKLFCGEQCFFVCDTAMQVFGGLGYEQGTAVEAMFRDSRVFRFGGGTDEIQRHIIQRDEYKRLSAARGSGAAPG